MSNQSIEAAAARRRPAPRRATMALRPQIESMEKRQLLSATPFIVAVNARATEGTGTNVANVFTVKLTSPSTVPVSLDYSTVSKTATAGSDFRPTSGTLVFNPGETSKSVTVWVMGDSSPELTETFGLVLSDAKNATLLTKLAMGSILDNDAVVDPKLSVSDASMKRGLDGSQTMHFTVSLNTAVKAPVTVSVATSNLTAIAGVDYVAKSQLFTFDAGETSKDFAVTIFGTSKPGSDKLLFVKLSDATLPVADATAVGILKYGA